MRIVNGKRIKQTASDIQFGSLKWGTRKVYHNPFTTSQVVSKPAPRFKDKRETGEQVWQYFDRITGKTLTASSSGGKGWKRIK